MNLVRRFGILSAVAALALAFCMKPAPALAQAPDAEKKITINLRETPLRTAIDLIFAGTGFQYSIDPNVQNVPITLQIRDVSLQQALRLIVRQAAVAIPGLTQSKDGDVYSIKIRPPSDPARTDIAEPTVEETVEDQEYTWEKIPIQFNHVLVFVYAFGGQILPSEAELMMGGGGMGGMGGGMMGGGGMGGGMGGMGGGMGGMGGGMGGMGGGGMGGGGFGGGGMGGGGFGGGGFGGGGMGGGGFGGGGLGGFGGGGGGGFGGGGGGGFGGGGRGGRF